MSPEGGHLPAASLHHGPGAGTCAQAAAEGAALGGSGAAGTAPPISKAPKFADSGTMGFVHNSSPPLPPSLCSWGLRPPPQALDRHTLRCLGVTLTDGALECVWYFAS